MVMSLSVASFVFNDGIILAADVFGSWGNMVNERVFILVLGEDWSDADLMKETVDAKVYVERICQVKKSLLKKMEVK